MTQLTLVEPPASSGRCARCGRNLRASASVERRMGPVCASKDLERATDALDLAFDIAWQAAGAVDDRALARRWFRAGAQAKDAPAT